MVDHTKSGILKHEADNAYRRLQQGFEALRPAFSHNCTVKSMYHRHFRDVKEDAASRSMVSCPLLEKKDRIYMCWRGDRVVPDGHDDRHAMKIALKEDL
jgi:hypothetical protein